MPFGIADTVRSRVPCGLACRSVSRAVRCRVPFGLACRSAPRALGRHFSRAWPTT